MRVVFVAFAAFALSCASNAPPRKQDPPVAEPTPARVAPEARADLTPVARPDNVIAVGRLPKPKTFVDRLASWRVSPRFEELFGRRLRGDGDQVAPDASIDVIVAIERSPAGPAPEPYLVSSVGLVSLAAAREALSSRGVTFERARAGIHRFSDADGKRCALAPSRGTSPARLVCGDSRRALDELLPYATRGLAAEPPPSEDARFDLDVARFRALHGKRLADLKPWAMPFIRLALNRTEPALASALAPLLESLYDESLDLIGDVDRIALTAALQSEQIALQARLSLGRDAKSYFGQTLFDAAKRQAPPPDAFWKLPSDAHFVFFSHGMSPERATTLRKTLSGALARGARTRTPGATFDLVVEALFPEPPFVYAFGLLDPALDPRPSYASSIRRRTERVLGWHVVGIDTDAKLLEKRLDRGMKDYNAGPLRDLVYGEFPSLCEGLPKIARRPAPPKGLPKSSVLYEMIVPGKLFEDCAARHGLRSPKPPPPLGIAVVFVPSKPRNWLVISPNTEFAIAKMQEVLRASDERTVGSLRLEQLKKPALFGAALSSELSGADHLRFVSRPRAARNTARVSVEGQREVVIEVSVAAAALAERGR